MVLIKCKYPPISKTVDKKKLYFFNKESYGFIKPVIELLFFISFILSNITN